MKWYKCTFTPVNQYFFGGEKIFDFDGANDYYITSLALPSQSTLLGALRFLVLKKAGKLSPENSKTSDSLKDEQVSLIGSSGDVMSNSDSYGVIKRISPLYLQDHDDIYVRTPFNHNADVSKTEYTPFTMKDGFLSEHKETILPADYNAKEGLTDSYLNLTTKKQINSSDIFGYQEQTHIARQRDEKGELVLKDKAFFKKAYCFFKKEDFSFLVYVQAEENMLPEHELVYLGQEKSLFEFKSDTCDDADPVDRIDNIVSSLYKANEGYKAYCLISDCYFSDYEKINDLLSFSIVDKKGYRFLTDTRNGENFKNRIKKSEVQYQFAAAGSVFFVKEEKAADFKELINENINMQKSGFNHIVEFKGEE